MLTFKMLRSNSTKVIVIIVLVSALSVTSASEYVPDTPPEQLSYLFHLYYDNGQLVADRDFEFKYDIIPEEFVPETYNTQFPFKGEVINFKNEVAASFLFDPRKGDQRFLKGKVAVKAPYVPDADKVYFYDNQGNQLLTFFVGESSFCDDDGICNSDRGESQDTCPADCKAATTPVPVIPGEGGGQGGMLMAAIYVLIVAGAGLGGWFGGSAIWRRWKKRKETINSLLPPITQ